MKDQAKKALERLPQAELIADRMLFMFRDRWPLVYFILTSECLSSMRAIVVNDIDCLLKALRGDKEAQMTIAFMEEEMKAQRLLAQGAEKEKNKARRDNVKKIVTAK